MIVETREFRERQEMELRASVSWSITAAIIVSEKSKLLVSSLKPSFKWKTLLFVSGEEKMEQRK